MEVTLLTEGITLGRLGSSLQMISNMLPIQFYTQVLSYSSRLGPNRYWPNFIIGKNVKHNCGLCARFVVGFLFFYCFHLFQPKKKKR